MTFRPFGTTGKCPKNKLKPDLVSGFFKLKGNFMKRILLLFLCALILTLCACEREVNNTQSSSVTINLASDNTVNGYRESVVSKENTEPSDDSTTHKPITSGTNPDSTVSINSTNTESNETSIEFCANKNSKVFHISSCGSVKTMKDENKYFSSDRDSLINEGYTPCKRCNP